MAEGEYRDDAADSASTPFLFEIEDSFHFASRGCVAVVGRVVRGNASAGEPLDLVGFAREPKRAVLLGVEAPNVFGGLPRYLLEGVTREEVHRGMVLASPGSVRPATTFRGEVFFDERHERISQQPLKGICRYSFYIRMAGIYGTLYLPAGKERIVHGDRFTATIALIEPYALEVGLWFGIGRLLGQGTILEVIG